MITYSVKKDIAAYRSKGKGGTRRTWAQFIKGIDCALSLYFGIYGYGYKRRDMGRRRR
ncbi:hypothetical protein [Ruminococcus albus]|uniref:hypothetical protein n=1 Tax=Ruminococcus albus TaxID=1264 RepID=UPI001A9A40EB|nr:hypothetical protein [Ruminococcus albus]